MGDQTSRMIDRAVDLWCKKLCHPVFDNGDDSPHGSMSHALATINILTAKDKINDMPKRIEKFRKALTKVLVMKRIPFWLDVDYGPSQELADAAFIAGIPKSQFSCKSSVTVLKTHVLTSFGYGAEDINHYPLPNGDWLLTTLTGSDINKVIDHVANGNAIGFDVDKPENDNPKDSKL